MYYAVVTGSTMSDVVVICPAYGITSITSIPGPRDTTIPAVYTCLYCQLELTQTVSANEYPFDSSPGLKHQYTAAAVADFTVQTQQASTPSHMRH